MVTKPTTNPTQDPPPYVFDEEGNSNPFHDFEEEQIPASRVFNTTDHYATRQDPGNYNTFQLEHRDLEEAKEAAIGAVRKFMKDYGLDEDASKDEDEAPDYDFVRRHGTTSGWHSGRDSPWSSFGFSGSNNVHGHDGPVKVKVDLDEKEKDHVYIPQGDAREYPEIEGPLMTGGGRNNFKASVAALTKMLKEALGTGTPAAMQTRFFPAEKEEEDEMEKLLKEGKYADSGAEENLVEERTADSWLTMGTSGAHEYYHKPDSGDNEPHNVTDDNKSQTPGVWHQNRPALRDENHP